MRGRAAEAIILDPLLFDRKAGSSTATGRAFIALSGLAFTADTADAAMKTALAAAAYVSEDGRPWCAWHAVAAVTGNLATCNCSPCAQARAKGGK